MASEFKKSNLRYQKYFLNIKAVYSTRQDLRMFLEILLSIVAVSFFVFFAIRPTLVTIGKLLTDIKEKESISAQLTTKIENLQIARQLYESNKTQIDLLNLSIPDSPNPEAIIRQIEGLAQTNNVTIVKITAEDIDILGDGAAESQPTLEGFKNMQISFIVSGNYTNISNFMEQAENMRRPLKIDEVIVNSANNGTSITISAVTQGIYYADAEPSQNTGGGL